MEDLSVNRHEAVDIRNSNNTTNNVSGSLIEEESLEDQIARSIHGIFDSLPAKCKPRTSISGVSEWIPLSSIAIVRGDSLFSNPDCL